ncbi:MAG TPA: hypothetical protein VF516_32240 [Kofleriaceae bacterium]
MDQLFTVGEYAKRNEIENKGRLRHMDKAAVYRFDGKHWCLLLNEGNGFWNDRALPTGEVLMEVNPRPDKRRLNFDLEHASSRSQCTYMFYRKKGDEPETFEYLGEVRCIDRQGNFLVFTRLVQPAAALPPAAARRAPPSP